MSSTPRPRPIPMVFTVNTVLSLHYNGSTQNIMFLYPVGETSVERQGNAIRVYWKYRHDGVCDPWRDGFEIAIDDIGVNGARIHPLTFCSDHQSENEQ